MRVLPTGCSSSRTAPAGVLPTGYSTSEMVCCSGVPPQVTAPARTLLQCGLSMGPCIFLQGTFTCCNMESSSTDCRAYVLHHSHPWAAWVSLPHHGLLHRLQENLFSDAWSTFSPSFFTDLGVCGPVFLTFSHSSLTAILQQLLLFLKYVFTDTLLMLLMGSALAMSGSVWNRFCPTWGFRLVSSHRSHPCIFPLLPKS